MSNLSDLLPSGGGQNIVEFTASGTVASGKPVVLNANGTVSQIALTSTSKGSVNTWQSGAYSSASMTYDENAGKSVIFYRDSNNSNYGTAAVVSISGTTVSVGTPVVFASANIYNGTMGGSATYDSNAQKVVYAYFDFSDTNPITGQGKTKSVVGTVSGTSISFGSPTSLESENTDYSVKLAFDSTRNKVIAVYRNASNSGRGEARVGTISGTDCSWESSTVFQSLAIQYPSVAYDPVADRCLITYQSQGAHSSKGAAVVATNNGTSLSYGTISFFSGTDSASLNAVVYDSVQKVMVIAYRSGSDNSGNVIAGTISGSSITLGSVSQVETGTYVLFEGAFDASANKSVFVYRDGNNSNYTTLTIATVSGTSVTASETFLVDSVNGNPSNVAYDAGAGKSVVLYTDSSKYAVAVTVSSTNLSATNFLGLADAAISDTATGKINVKGSINSKQSSLTIGSDYYVQTDGTVTTSSTSPAQKIGQAVTATTINMMDLT